MRLPSIILIGLLSSVYVNRAEEVSTTRSTTSVDTTSVETAENTTPISSTTEVQALIEPTAEELILKLLTTNTVALNDSSNLLSKIEDDVVLSLSSLNQQLMDLQQLGSMDVQFAKSSYLVKDLSLNILQGISNTKYKVGLDIESTTQALENMVKEQQEATKQISELQKKLNECQKNVINSSQLIDNSIVHLTKLVSRSVLPKLDHLKSQFSSLNTSQINIQAELPVIAVTQAISENSIKKLNDLNQQLTNINYTKDIQLQKISDILEYMAPKNLTVIANRLQDLVIQEKRIDLELSICNQLSTSESKTSSQKENYELQYVKPKRSSESHENQKIYLKQQSENIATNINSLKSEQRYQTEDLIYELPESTTEMKSLNNPFYSQERNTKSEKYEVFENKESAPKSFSRQEKRNELSYLIPETAPKTQERSPNNPFYKQQCYQPIELKPKSAEYEIYTINQPASKTISEQRNLAPVEVSYSIPETVGNYDNEEAHKFIESLELNPNLILQSEKTSPTSKPFEIYSTESLHTEKISKYPDYYASNSNARDNFRDIESYQTNDNLKEIFSINNAQIF